MTALTGLPQELLTCNKLSELACLTLYMMYEKLRGSESRWCAAMPSGQHSSVFLRVALQAAVAFPVRRCLSQWC